MIKSKLGLGMVVSDRVVLDRLLDNTISVVGNDYSDVFNYVVDILITEEYPSALKSHAIRRSSWLKKYIFEYVQTH